VKKSLYIIFVNYNSGKQLHEGVKLVLKSPSVTGLIIVDNASQDESLQYLNTIKHTKKIVLIKNNKNLGFYKALNVAIKKAFKLKADMVMPLDFDLGFTFDFITKLSKVDGDIVAPVLTFERNKKWFYDYGGRINWITGSVNHLIKSRTIKTPKAIISSVKRTRANWYDFVSGGCTIIKREVIEKVGYFDEDYFLYFGDADYVLQARKQGFKVVIDATTVVHHKIEFPSQTGNFKKLRISFFDNLTFIHKRIKWFLKPVAYANILSVSVRILFGLFLHPLYA